MNEFNVNGRKAGISWQSSAKAGLLAALAVLLSGCYTPAAYHDYTRDGTVPWWCKGSPDLTQQECVNFSLSLDAGVYAASSYPTLGSFTAAGGTEIANRPNNIGVPYTRVATPIAFDPNAPNVVLYDGNTPTARQVGVAWEIDSATAPEGFAGDRDVWSQDGTTGHWWLTAWVVRGYENHPNVFAASHPCLTNTGTILTSTSDSCFTASHTEPFEIVVTNDDGYSAPGIDALVEALYSLPNVSVHVVAPFANQSGSGESRTRKGYVVSASAVTTASGKPATAISSTDPQRFGGSGSPADAVLYALSNLNLSPELVVSGINAGQNMGPVVTASGTVGAARIARRNGVPSIATSQGGIAPPNDFPTGRTATLALIEEWRLGRTVNTTSSVLNINIPTCAATFSPRGTLQTVVAPDLLGRSYTTQDCASTVVTILDDVDAFNNGFIGIADVGASKPPNWP
ncbi:MAG: 5'/3'-nucleotidase SurE [Halioglobus sp.]